MALPLIGGALIAGGLIGSALQKTPKYDRSAIDNALASLNKQYLDAESFYSDANKLLESQYGSYFAESMGEEVNRLANSGIYESPAGEISIGKSRRILADVYAESKSKLAGERLNALSEIESKKLDYQARLLDAKYQRDLAKASKKASLLGGLGGLGSALLFSK